MRRAKRSERTPKASCENDSVGSTRARCSCGWSSLSPRTAREPVRRSGRSVTGRPRSRAALHASPPGGCGRARRRRHRTDEPAVVVDDGQRDEVVGGEGAGHLLEGVARDHRVDLLVDDRPDRGVRRLAEQALDVHEAEVATGGHLERRPADVDHRGERGRKLLAAHRRQGLGDRGLRPEDDRLGRHHAAGGVLVVGEQAPQGSRLVGLHELEQLLGLLGRQVCEQVGGVVGLHRLQHVGSAGVREAGEDLDLVVLGELLEDVGESIVVERRGDLGAPLRVEVVDDLCEVGDLEVVIGLEQTLGALRPSCSCRPTTSRMSTSIVLPERRRVRRDIALDAEETSVAAWRTKTLTPSHSRRGPCSIARSSTMAVAKPASTASGAVTVTVRSKSSAATSTSLVRCSKRRMLTSPVVMTAPASIEVTRVIGTKTRRRPGTSTTRPMTRGCGRLAENITTTSRTRPTGSPSGSKTARPVRRATKTRGFALMAPRLWGQPPRETAATTLALRLSLARSRARLARLRARPLARLRAAFSSPRPRQCHGRHPVVGRGGAAGAARRRRRHTPRVPRAGVEGHERGEGARRAHRVSESSVALSRDARSSSAALSHSAVPGSRTWVWRAQRQQPAAGVLAAQDHPTSSGSHGSGCSPGPLTTYAAPSSHTCQAGQVRSPATSIQSSPTSTSPR